MIIVIIGIILIVFGFILNWNEVSGIDMIFAIFGTAFFIGGLKITNPRPQAIDVYRGNTTLEITYRDSIPVDTVVVWR